MSIESWDWTPGGGVGPFRIDGFAGVAPLKIGFDHGSREEGRRAVQPCSIVPPSGREGSVRLLRGDRGGASFDPSAAAGF